LARPHLGENQAYNGIMTARPATIADFPPAIIENLSEARRVHVFTGAGMSAESGLETYRNDKTGLWENVDPQAMASIDAWARDPEPMWAWYLWRAHVAEDAQPNAGHIALAEWEQLCDSMLVTTQNIDNLHERAGSQHIAHLHGSLFAWRCSICGRPYRIMELPTQPAARLTPPECPLCHNPVRPGVVWFGESLPQREWELAEQWMMIADVVVVVGTSGVVYPAAALPRIAYECGTPIIEISPAATDLTPLATVSWATTAAQGLPELVAKVQESRG
jgi:NAD-dependent deacetylase 2